MNYYSCQFILKKGIFHWVKPCSFTGHVWCNTEGTKCPCAECCIDWYFPLIVEWTLWLTAQGWHLIMDSYLHLRETASKLLQVQKFKALTIWVGQTHFSFCCHIWVMQYWLYYSIYSYLFLIKALDFVFVFVLLKQNVLILELEGFYSFLLHRIYMWSCKIRVHTWK